MGTKVSSITRSALPVPRIPEVCQVSSIRTFSIGTAAQAHLGASVANLDYPGDAAGAQLYLDDVVADRVQYDHGHLVVPTGPGLGMELDEGSLKKLTDRTWEFMKR